MTGRLRPKRKARIIAWAVKRYGMPPACRKPGYFNWPMFLRSTPLARQVILNDMRRSGNAR